LRRSQPTAGEGAGEDVDLVLRLELGGKVPEAMVDVTATEMSVIGGGIGELTF